MIVKVPQKVQDKVFELFKKRLKQKLKIKGDFSFNSRVEILGKMNEEMFELTQAIHSRNEDNMIEEQLDMMIVGFWGVCSRLSGAWDDSIKWKKNKKRK